MVDERQARLKKLLDEELPPAQRSLQPAAPQRDRYDVQHPVYKGEKAHVPEGDIGAHLCGSCPGWHRTSVAFPFGQCLPAIRAFGQPMYTPELAGCTLPMEKKLKRGAP